MVIEEAMTNYKAQNPKDQTVLNLEFSQGDCHAFFGEVLGK